jgi:hypothetical protein
VQSIIDNLTKLISIVDFGINFELFNQTSGNLSEIAEQSVDILMNRDTGESTFTPLKTRDEFLEAKRKMIQD